MSAGARESRNAPAVAGASSAAPVFRVYEDAGKDGYPAEWHRLSSAHGTWPGIKDIVREQAGHRCVRCGHPYRKGEHGKGEWTPCDERCTHGGPMRLRHSGFADQLISREEIGTNAGRLLQYDREHVCVNPANPREVLSTLHVDAQWRILTVHHLNGDKLDCRWWNLASLCQRCHLTIQGRVVMARVWPWEHTDWFKPYVAGYYASVYLGEELNREQVSARLDELLSLELAGGTPTAAKPQSPESELSGRVAGQDSTP